MITTLLESFNENIIYQFITISFFILIPFTIHISTCTCIFLLGLSQNQFLFSLPFFWGLCLTWKIITNSITFFSLFITTNKRVGENGAWDELPEIHTNSSEASYVVRGLLPFTVYSFRILAVNKLGVSVPSKESYYICTLREGMYIYGNK